MARGRMLSIDVAGDPQLNRLSLEAHLLYVQTIPHLDRDGLVNGHPLLLWAKVAPLRVELMDKAPALIDEWVQQGLVIRYDGRDGPVLFFKGFRRHQVNMPYAKEQESRFPPPPGWVRTKAGLMPENDDLRRSLAQRFDTRTAYYKALTSDASKMQALCTQGASNMRAEDQDQVEVEEQHEVKQHDVAGAAEKVSPPTLVVQENNTRTHAHTRTRLSEMPEADQLPQGAGLDPGQARSRESVLEAWAAMMIDSLWGVGVWNDAGRYLSRLPNDELENLARWLWKCNWLNDWFNAPSSPVGVGLIRKMVADGQGAGLPTGQLRLMEDELDAFADPAAALFHGDPPHAERNEHEIDY